MVEGCHQVRLNASEALAQSFVLLPDFEKRKNLMRIVQEDFFENGNFQRKETFINFANFCLDVFSRQAFKFFLLGKLLVLSTEDIESILILFVKLLPKIHNILDPLKDQNLLESIKSVKK
jgi:hypothetical protein